MHTQNKTKQNKRAFLLQQWVITKSLKSHISNQFHISQASDLNKKKQLCLDFGYLYIFEATAVTLIIEYMQ